MGCRQEVPFPRPDAHRLHFEGESGRKNKNPDKKISFKKKKAVLYYYFSEFLLSIIDFPWYFLQENRTKALLIKYIFEWREKERDSSLLPSGLGGDEEL